jgi:large subunit ribosomal protein L24
MMARVKKNDTVIVLTGKDRDKKGTVIALDFKKGKVMVKGIAIATRHAKARKQGEVSGIRQEESFISLSNVMPVCSSCKKPCRINIKSMAKGSRARSCNECEEIF